MSWLDKGFYLGSKGLQVRKLSPGRILLRVVLSILALVIALVVAMILFKDRLTFFPVKGLDVTMADTGWPFEEVWLTGSSGGRLHCWHLPGPEGSRTVLLLGGNAGNLEVLVGRVIMWHRLGYGVLAVEYEGFGLSDGEPSEEALYFDAGAAWDYLIERGTPPESVVIHGFSLGGGVASKLALEKAERHNPLILDSTFTNIADVAAWHLPVMAPAMGLVFGKAFDTLGRLPGLSPSTLIVLHSPTDEVVPYELGRRVFEAYGGGEKVFVELLGAHMDFPANQDKYQAIILETLGRGAPEPSADPEDPGPGVPAADPAQDASSGAGPDLSEGTAPAAP